jgi:hypothetical protein
MPSSGGVRALSAATTLDPSLTAFECQQHSLLSRLLGRRADVDSPGSQCSSEASPFSTLPADPLATPRFNLGGGAHDPAAAAAHQQRSPHPPQGPAFTDDIRFVSADDRTNSYQFSAGSTASSSSDQQRIGRRHERLRTRRASRKSSPLKRPAISDEDDEEEGASNESPQESRATTDSEKARAAFDPDRWMKEFDPQTFVPKPGATPVAKSGSPTRRPSSKRRVRSVKPTMGNAGLADDSGSNSSASGDDSESRSASGPPTNNMSDLNSPSAMDIDEEPPVPAATASSQVPPPYPPQSSGSNGARNIPVEPSRPDWRAGDAGAGARADVGASPPCVPPHPPHPPHAHAHGPSEDSEEFRATFADFRNVAPFAPEGTGLDSVGDLKSTLPFETQASARIPIARKPVAAPQEVPLPPAPQCPPPPVPVDGPVRPTWPAWEMYVRLFETYMGQWDEFNEFMVTHFFDRAKAQREHGYAFLRAAGDGNLHDYAAGVRQDIIVREKWLAACVEHEKRVNEFVAFRAKMA